MQSRTDGLERPKRLRVGIIVCAAAGSPYEAHLTKADGADVTVKVDANFAVTATEQGFGGGGPHGGPGGPGGPGDAPSTSSSAA